MLYKDMGRKPEALLLFERALDIREEELGATHANTATSVWHLSLYRLLSLRDPATALPLLERLLHPAMHLPRTLPVDEVHQAMKYAVAQ